MGGKPTNEHDDRKGNGKKGKGEERNANYRLITLFRGGRKEAERIKAGANGRGRREGRRKWTLMTLIRGEDGTSGTRRCRFSPLKISGN